jgi:succinate dehydrogenase / fumarate reductase flavoprotein subunit
MRETDVKISGILGRTAGESLFPLLESFREMMFARFGIFREASAMDQGLRGILELQQRLGTVAITDKNRAVNQALLRYLELEAMLPVAEAVARGAIERKESRGSHTRTDYPARDDSHYLHHTIAAMENGKIVISASPVTLGMFTPEERVY